MSVKITFFTGSQSQPMGVPSGLDWTIARPGLLTNSPETGRYRALTASKDWRFGAISRADVADFLVLLINDRAVISTAPLLIR